MKKILSILLASVLLLITSLFWTGCTPKKQAASIELEEGFFGEYVVIDIEDYIEMTAYCMLLEYLYEYGFIGNDANIHKCLIENDLVITSIKCDDGLLYWLILCETCHTYTLVCMS